MNFIRTIATKENLYAFLLFLALLALTVFTADASPVWIYQGF